VDYVPFLEKGYQENNAQQVFLAEAVGRVKFFHRQWLLLRSLSKIYHVAVEARKPHV